jgi:hypothetical protein
LNPCSQSEMKFMFENKLDNLFLRTVVTGNHRVPVIAGIEGSYFNVMGLPVVELVDELNAFKS